MEKIYTTGGMFNILSNLNGASSGMLLITFTSVVYLSTNERYLYIIVFILCIFVLILHYILAVLLLSSGKHVCLV